MTTPHKDQSLDELNKARPPKTDDGSWLQWRNKRLEALQQEGKQTS